MLLETVFCRGQILSPILRLSQLRDEGFSRFWIKFSGKGFCYFGSFCVDLIFGVILLFCCTMQVCVRIPVYDVGIS